MKIDEDVLCIKVVVVLVLLGLNHGGVMGCYWCEVEFCLSGG